MEDCAQLVKANSILGNKENNLYVVYTPWQGARLRSQRLSAPLPFSRFQRST